MRGGPIQDREVNWYFNDHENRKCKVDFSTFGTENITRPKIFSLSVLYGVLTNPKSKNKETNICWETYIYCSSGGRGWNILCSGQKFVKKKARKQVTISTFYVCKSRFQSVLAGLIKKGLTLTITTRLKPTFALQ